MGKRRRQTHNLAGDQFGEYDEPRGEFGGGGGAGGGAGGKGGGGGGGTAGASGPRGGSVALAPRAVPKFLQAYAHLLPNAGGAPREGGGEDEPLVVGSDGAAAAAKRARPHGDNSDDDGDDDPVQAEAIARALEDNPELAAELEKEGGTTNTSAATLRVRKARAATEKARGNDAFADGRHAEAERAFSAAIALDASDPVFWSNRAAARAAMGKHEAALADAREAARLRPEWAKAHARIGAALEALGCADEAEEAYRRASMLEPADTALRQSVERAAAAARKLRREGKHVFRSGGGGGGGAGGKEAAGGGKPAAPAPVPPPPAPSVPVTGKKTMLSFADDDDDEEEGE
jgi:Flp pilus assembly protein TadD